MVSFGYHVSNFFAASSRFGTPEDLKRLIDEAHGMELPSSWTGPFPCRKERNGRVGNFDGTPEQYFHDGARREHVAWDSLCFDYGKDHVLHFYFRIANSGSMNTNLTDSVSMELPVCCIMTMDSIADLPIMSITMSGQDGDAIIYCPGQ